MVQDRFINFYEMTKDTNKENALRVIRYIQRNTGGKELNHLLLAIPKFAMVNDNERLALVSLQENGGKFDYDLTKTVQENLESNPDLCNYFINLFGL